MWLSMVSKSGGGGRSSVSWKLMRDRKTEKKETGMFRLTGLVTWLATATDHHMASRKATHTSKRPAVTHTDSFPEHPSISYWGMTL